MSRGRPFEPGNKCGHGRPKGRPNKKTPEAQALFEQNSAAIMALAINSSREDPQMLRMLASRVVARLREAPVKIGPLPMSTLSDLDRASEVTLQNATGGKLGLSEAREISNMIDIRRRVLVAQELDRRLSVLENGGGLLPDKGSGTPKKFVGTFEELLTMYREMTMGPNLEEGDQCGDMAAERDD
jgi:hypothetical protein